MHPQQMKFWLDCILVNVNIRTIREYTNTEIRDIAERVRRATKIIGVVFIPAFILA